MLAAADTSVQLPWTLLLDTPVAKQIGGDATIKGSQSHVLSGTQWRNRMDRHWVCHQHLSVPFHLQKHAPVTSQTHKFSKMSGHAWIDHTCLIISNVDCIWSCNIV